MREHRKGLICCDVVIDWLGMGWECGKRMKSGTTKKFQVSVTIHLFNKIDFIHLFN